MTEDAQRQVVVRPDPAAHFLRTASFFAGLPEEEIECFVKVSQNRLYKRGKILYLEKDLAEFFYVICSGWIKLFHVTLEGEEVVLDILTRGHSVGEDSLFEEGRHPTSAQVVEDAQLIALPLSLLQEQIRANNSLTLNMLAAISRHHIRRNRETVHNAIHNAPQRIGYFLLRLCPADKKQDIVLHLPFDKLLIASILGMKSATFSRALNNLREKTGIRIQGTRVEIDSVDQLLKFLFGPACIHRLSFEDI